MPDTHTALDTQIQAKTEAFQEIFDAIHSGTEHEGQDADDALYEAPLELIVTKKVTMVLCTGGPHVQVTAQLHDDGELSDVSIQGWWGDSSAEHEVDVGSPIYRALQTYVQGLLIG